MSIGKKIGYGFLSVVPFFGMLFTQLMVTVGIMILLAVSMMYQDGSGELMGYIARAGMLIMNDYYIETIMATQIVSLFIFGLWYYLAFVRKEERIDTKPLWSVKNLVSFLMIGFSVYLFITFYMEVVNLCLPKLMEEYMQLIDMSRIAELSVVSTIASIVLAPLGEETVFRGLTMKYLRKAGAGFWVANIIQAALFGALHLNWVQSSYAFGLGIFLGCMGRRFRTLAAPMLLHMIFNFYGTYVAVLMEDMPENIWLKFLIVPVAVVLAFIAFKWMGRVEEPVG